MKAPKAVPALLLAAILSGFFAPQALAVISAPAWSLQSLASPTNFSPGEESGLDLYEIILTNSGGAVSDGSPVTIEDELQAGLGVKSVLFQRHVSPVSKPEVQEPSACETELSGTQSTLRCVLEGADATLRPGEAVRLEIHLKVPPSAAGPLANEVTAEGGGAEQVSTTSRNQASTEGAPSGFQEIEAALIGADGKPTTGAAAHPYAATTTFAVNTELAPPGSTVKFRPADGDLKQIEVALPPGLIGNPSAVERCPIERFNSVRSISSPGVGSGISLNECPDRSAVGVLAIQQLEGAGGVSFNPVYNLVPPKGMPAQLGFQILGLPVYINTKLRSDSDYGITAYLDNTTEAKRVTAAKVTVWGVPGDESHDSQRGSCLQVGGSCPFGTPPVPFFRLPTSCADSMTTTMSFDTWLNPGSFASASDTEPAPVACEQPDFSPTIEAKPTTNVADAPSGLHFDLHLPQKANEDPEGLGEADLRDATVTLPPGLVVNPSSADGLGACTEEQIGYLGTKEGRHAFSAEPADCPDAAKIGTVEVETPLLEDPLPGAVYLAEQHQNPFGSLIAIYISIDDPRSGVVVKLPGEVTPDPASGQLTTTVAQNPQLPFEDFRFEFFEGARAPLRTPQTCGPHTTNSTLVPWSAPAGAAAFPSDSFALAQAPGGGGCASSAAQLPNAPSFEAGTLDPLAGAYSPFVLRLKREDGSQELAGLNLTLPQGLTGKLAGIAECSEAQLAQAKAREVPGRGATEQASPSCPASSRLGSVTVGAGAGPAPFHAQGDAYLAGPYKGAPLSMAIITPAVAGPFDLGAVMVRAALRVDPESARITAVSDPIPTIIQGISLDVRSVAVKLDRPGFTLNPTSCEAMAISGEAISTLGQSAQLSNRFQVGGCQNLGFKPKLSFRLRGDTKRGGHPALTATLTYPSKGAYSNIAKAKVALPSSEFLAQAHIRTICTRVRFAANQCPKGSIYGKARAITPLLDKPLEGPVYLRSSSNPLPDLVADLGGQIHVALVGRVDSVNGRIRNSFEAVPDAPVSRFTLSLPAGKKGLLENSTDICRGKHKATATFTAHNGRVLTLRPELKARCGAKSRKGSKTKSKTHRRP